MSGPPTCPLCRAEVTGYTETPVTASTALVATDLPSVPSMTRTEVTARVEAAIPPDLLGALRSTTTTTGGRPQRSIQMPQRLLVARSLSSHHYTCEDYAWANHDSDEPHILPDTGAKDGLCGDRWGNHAGQWANAHGHKPYADQLPERRTVSGVGSGSQHADERVHIPIGLEDTKGRKFLSKYRAAMVRSSIFRPCGV